MSNDIPPGEPQSGARSGVVTVIVRLLERGIERGQLLGRAEVVATGEVADIRGADDLLRLAGHGSETPAD